MGVNILLVMCSQKRLRHDLSIVPVAPDGPLGPLGPVLPVGRGRKVSCALLMVDEREPICGTSRA